MRSTRCVCGHPADVHEHYRPGADCGHCGPGMCPWYIALADRDELAGMLTAGQRLLLAESDANAYRVMLALVEFTPGYRERVRAEAVLSARIPAQRPTPTTIGSELEARRAARRAGSRGSA